jgi:hypothetical protein
MPIHYYTWTASLEGESISFRILESSEDDARQQLLQKIQDFQAFRKTYEKFERQIHVNNQNKAFMEKKTLDAYAKGDESQAESLECALQTIHNSNRRLRYDIQWFLGTTEIDTLGMIEDVSPFSAHLDAVVQTSSGENMPLRQFILTNPTITPAHKIEIFHNTL